LSTYGLKHICLSTVYNWMEKLGFKYEEKKKGYHVDEHERKDTVNYHRKFVYSNTLPMSIECSIGYKYHLKKVWIWKRKV